MGVNVTYGGDSIPKTPFTVPVAPSLDLSKIRVAGLGDRTLLVLFVYNRFETRLDTSDELIWY